MMLFDLTPLTTRHLWLAGEAFAVVWLLLLLLQLPSPWQLRPKKGTKVLLAGSVLVAVIVGLAGAVLPDTWQYIGLVAAAIVVLGIGTYDEQRELPAWIQFIGQIIVALVVVSFGWSIQYVTHPFAAGVINLADYTVLGFFSLGALVTIVWLVALMNVINWLDGSDGLASGVGVVTFGTLAAISLLPQTQDSQTLALALIGGGAVLGFLLWNMPPARVYLGTVGSWWLGLYIGLVALVGGGKVATVLLVLALPVIDAASVIIRRLLSGQRPWQKDTRHIHHLLLARGWSPGLILGLALMISVGCGVAAVVLQTYQKVIALGLAAGMLCVVIVYLLTRSRSI